MNTTDLTIKEREDRILKGLDMESVIGAAKRPIDNANTPEDMVVAMINGAVFIQRKLDADKQV